MPTKPCTKCGQQKELGEFYRMTKSRDGHGYLCKACVIAANIRWNEANPDKIEANQLRWISLTLGKQSYDFLPLNPPDENLPGSWIGRIQGQARSRRVF